VVILLHDKQLTENWYGQGESDCLIKTKRCDGVRDLLTQRDFCPGNIIKSNFIIFIKSYIFCNLSVFHNSALNVKLKKFNQARVNGGSNYDSLKVAKCLVI
jgi:hypothetical protein